MKILIITQNESLFLPKALDYLLRRFPSYVNLVGCIIFDPSPYGKKKNIFSKVFSALSTFGFRFVFRYGSLALWNIWKKRSITQILSTHKVSMIKMHGNINSDNSLDKINELKPDLIISIAGNQIFRKKLINIPSLGLLNLHSALLPKYRGLMPSFWVLKNNECQTGVSVFFVDEGIDSGPIIVQKKIKIHNISQFELIRMTKILGMDAIVESVEKIHNGNYDLLLNDDQNSTYFSFPTKDDIRDFRKSGGRFF